MPKDAEPRVKPDSERKAIPLPEGIIDPKALERAGEAWREQVDIDRFGLPTAKQSLDREQMEKREREARYLPLDSSA